MNKKTLFEEKNPKLREKKPVFNPGESVSIKTKLYYEGNTDFSQISDSGKANKEYEAVWKRMQKLGIVEQVPQHPSPLMDALLKVVYYAGQARHDFEMLAVDNQGITTQIKQKLYAVDEVRHTANDLIALVERYKAF